MARALSVRLHGSPVGRLVQNETGRLSFAYDPTWAGSAEARPLSFALPLREEAFEHEAARAFFAGYLPESDAARAAIGRMFSASPRNDFALLAAIGRDCAGAVSLHPEDDPVVPDADCVPRRMDLDEAELARRLRDLPRRPLFLGEKGVRISLAGAQDKAAVHVEGGRIGLPIDGTPSTHVLKPALSHLEGSVANEHLCLRLAAALGLDVVRASVGRAQGIAYLLVERYDRRTDERGRVTRVHQEDLCQATGTPPDRKYENEGGPGFAALFGIADRCRAPALERLRFLDAALLSFLVGNPDAHAKNFSFLREATGARGAPLYDLMCGAVHPDIETRMAMRIARVYEPDDVLPRHWARWAEENRLGAAGVAKRLLEFAGRIGPEAERVRVALAAEGAGSPVHDRIVQAIEKRAERVRRDFSA